MKKRIREVVNILGEVPAECEGNEGGREMVDGMVEISI